MKRVEILFFLAILCSLFPFTETKANKHISPHHPYIRYSGRVDRSKKESISFDWPGVAIRCHFTGSSVGIKMNGGKDNYFNLFIDNVLISVIETPLDPSE